jgi:adenine-specific DNA-methyltransferase
MARLDSVTTIDLIESQRLEAQSLLDAAKTPGERNKLGQFATSTGLAFDMLEYAKTLLSPTLKIHFLDPAFGTGAFYSALLRTFSPSQIASASGYEIDSHYGYETIRLWANTPLKLNIANFTQVSPPSLDEVKANLLICNPPYVRHHHLSPSEKLRLQGITQQITGAKLSGLTGLYCYFLLISHGWLADGGLAGWLVPSEFMDVNYGQPVKRYLLERVTLLRIHRFDPNEIQFEDALVSSAVVWFKKATPPTHHRVEFTYGGTLTNPKISKHILVDTLQTAPKWSGFPMMADDAKSSHKWLKLSDLFEIKRGLATGSNKFFILTPRQVAKYQLPAEFLIPILPSPRYLLTDTIEADSNGNPLLEQQLFLLACNLAEDEVQAKYPSLWRYIQIGVQSEVSERYLSKHRSPWYAQENRPASPLLCTYMGRQSSSSRKPFRFILNHSKATAPNVYLMLYPKPALANILKSKPELLESIWQSLNKIPFETLMSEGRMYGGGLYKIEPNELANTPADNLLAVLPDLFKHHPRQLSFFD